MSEYVNNKVLLQAIIDWKTECRKQGTIVRQNDTIGKAIILIANGLSKRFNFSNYTASWKEEMCADGIEASIKGLINFNEAKYDNPHAYITQACFNAFVQRIKKERRETAKKYSYFVNYVYDSMDSDMVQIADETFIQDIHDKINQYETSAKAKPKDIVEQKPEVNNLDFLYEENN